MLPVELSIEWRRVLAYPTHCFYNLGFRFLQREHPGANGPSAPYLYKVELHMDKWLMLDA